jgi:hypothetical protein
MRWNLQCGECLVFSQKHELFTGWGFRSFKVP